MPIRPPAYEVPSSSGPSATGAGYGGRVSTGSLTPSGGSPGIRVSQMNTESLAGFWQSIGRGVNALGKHEGELAKQEALRQKAVLDNEVMSHYSTGVLAMDELSRTLKSEGIGSDRFMQEWDKRTSALMTKLDAKASTPDVRRVLAHKLIPHLVESRLKAGLFSDGLLRDETVGQIKQFGALAEGQAANLNMPEEPLVKGSKSYAFGFLEDLNERVDAAERRGIIKKEEAVEWKRKYREAAHYARGEAMVRDTPEVFEARAKNESDPLIGNMDPNQKHALMKRAEERSAHLRSVRLAEDSRADRVMKDSQDRWLGVTKSSMDVAFQTQGNLQAFAQEIVDMGHLLGPENKSKAFDHLRTLQTAARERDAVRAKPWTDEDHAAYAKYRAKVFSGEISDPTRIIADGSRGLYRVDKADELVGLRYSISEDTRKAEIQANAKHVEKMLEENIGMLAKFNKTAATAQSMAATEFMTTALADRKLSGPALTKLASDIIDRHTKAIQSQIGKPEELLKTLPVIKGTKLDNPDAIIKAWRSGDISEAQANRYKATIDYVGTVQGMATEKKNEKGAKDKEAQQKKDEPGILSKGVKTLSEGLFGRPVHKGEQP